MNKRCTKQGCGSYAFNLYQGGIGKGELCDSLYWQDRAEKAEQANKVQADGHKPQQKIQPAEIV